MPIQLPCFHFIQQGQVAIKHDLNAANRPNSPLYIYIPFGNCNQSISHLYHPSFKVTICDLKHKPEAKAYYTKNRLCPAVVASKS